MSQPPSVRFLSLFVPDLDAAQATYQQLLGIPPFTGETSAPTPHPFAARGPVVFDLGTVHLALYQCAPQRGTHPGDVGIGVESSATLKEAAHRAKESGAQVFFGPSPLPGDGRQMMVYVTPDRHFLEWVDAKPR